MILRYGKVGDMVLLGWESNTSIWQKSAKLKGEKRELRDGKCHPLYETLLLLLFRLGAVVILRARSVGKISAYRLQVGPKRTSLISCSLLPILLPLNWQLNHMIWKT